MKLTSIFIPFCTSGEKKISPVTGEVIKVYPAWKRMLAYLFSAIVTGTLLSIVSYTIILSLNIQGYVHPRHNPLRWISEDSHPFYFPYLASLSEPGAMFDINTYFSLIPVVVHVVVIMILNTFYQYVANWLTNLENHETIANHENSVIIKRFLFEVRNMITIRMLN